MNRIKTMMVFCLALILCQVAMGAETVHVATAGTLEAAITAQASVDKTAITEITITGNLNSTDIALLKTLSTSNNLSRIDMSEVTLVNNALANQALDETKKLQHIVLPRSLETLGTKCFQGSGIKTIEFPTANLKTISESCFAWCTKLVELSLPEGVETLGSTSLVHCTSLTKLTFPSTLKLIKGNAILGNLGFAPWTNEIPLVEIHAKMTTVPTVENNGLWLSADRKANCKLYVPAGTLAQYRANVTGSSGFGTIANIIDPSVVVIDYGLQTPIIHSPAPAGYDYITDKLSFTMSESIEMTPGGRIWANWIGGGDSEDAFSVLNWSDDGGKTWTEPKVVIDPHDATIGQTRRTIISVLWTDPNGKLWLFFDQSMTYYDGRGGIWATVCENPDDANPTWSEPKRLWHGMAINKPIVLSTGEWMLPLCLWPRNKMSTPYSTQNAYSELDADRKSHVLVSTDQGQTWTKRGGVLFSAEHQDFDETHVTEKKDGSLWMTARTLDGIYQSTSTDGGYTWATPTKYMNSAIARHFIRRLASGNLVLIKNGRINVDDGRKNMTAYLSEDDGMTWKGGLILDERSNVTYPDGFQAPDGTIYAAYDNRGVIYHIAAFTESDILAKEFLSPKAMQKGIITPVLNDVATVHVSTPGGLQAALALLPINTNFLRDVTITGSLNDADIALLKTMSTGEHSKLRIIDLSGVTLANNALPVEAFKNSSIESIKLPASLTTMGTYCFDNCLRLQFVDLPTTNLTVIPQNAFTRTALTKIDIPEGVTTIGIHAFTFCASLSELTLPSTLTHIGNGAFLGKVNETFNIPIPLKVVNAKMQTPPTMDGHGFCLGESGDPLWNSCVLNVPEEATAAYRANVYTDGFGYGFGKVVNIREETFTSIDNFQNSTSRITLLGNKSFVVESDLTTDLSSVFIYNVAGQLCDKREIKSAREVFEMEQAGIYIVKIDTVSFKVVL